MLQRIGDALKGTEGSSKRKWITYLLVGTLSIVFAAWGAYGIVNLSFGGSNYAAEAGGSKITLEQARNEWLREQGQWHQRVGGAFFQGYGGPRVLHPVPKRRSSDLHPL